LCDLSTFKIVLPLVGLSRRVIRVVILLFTMTTAVALSIVHCLILLFASAGSSGSFSIMISISGVFSSFLFPSDVVMFSSERGVVLGVVKVMVLFLDRLFFFDIIINHFAGIEGLDGWSVVRNHSSRVGTLTP